MHSTVDVSERPVASFGQKRSLMTACVNTTMRSFKLNTDTTDGSDVSSEWTRTVFLTPPGEGENKRDRKQRGRELNVANLKLVVGGLRHKMLHRIGPDGSRSAQTRVPRGNAELSQ